MSKKKQKWKQKLDEYKLREWVICQQILKELVFEVIVFVTVVPYYYVNLRFTFKKKQEEEVIQVIRDL